MNAESHTERRKGGKLANTVGPPNKGHVGDNINSLVMSFVERLSSSQRFSIYRNYRERDIKQCSYNCREVFFLLYPCLIGSLIGGLL